MILADPSVAADVEVLSSCPVCGGASLRSLAVPGVWINSGDLTRLTGHLGLQRCGGCGLVFTNPRPSEARLLEVYGDPAYDCHQDCYASEDARDAHMRLSVVERYCDRGSLLDFGCGAGALLAAAKERKWREVVGVDVGDEVRQRLLARGFSVYPTLDEAFETRGPFQAVTMIHLLEHLLDPGAVLRSVLRMLKPGGVFAVEVPNANSLRARLSESAIRSLFPAPGQRYQAYPIHLYYFNAGSLIRLLRKSGFEVVKVHSVGLGVEEMFPRATAPSAPTQASAEVAVGTAEAHPRSAGPIQLGKNLVKASMSRLRLGEQLLIVCRKPSGGSES